MHLVSQFIHHVDFAFLWWSWRHLVWLKVSTDILPNCVHWCLGIRIIVILAQRIVWGAGILIRDILIRIESLPLLGLRIHMQIGGCMIALELRPNSFLDHPLLYHVVQYVFGIYPYHVSLNGICLLRHQLLGWYTWPVILNSACRDRALFLNKFSLLLVSGSLIFKVFCGRLL